MQCHLACLVTPVTNTLNTLHLASMQCLQYHLAFLTMPVTRHSAVSMLCKLYMIYTQRPIAKHADLHTSSGLYMPKRGQSTAAACLRCVFPMLLDNK